jgi:haloalkane dehalogenase
MITKAVANGFRVIAPDLIGFGKSDKPANQDDYTYARHLEWLRSFLMTLGLQDIHLICQDWGGLLGLRLVAQTPDLFSAVIAANTMLPTGEHKASDAFLKWQQYSQTSVEFNVGNILQGATVTDLSEEVISAYNAPFPSDEYKAGVRKFPMLVPISTEDPESANNKLAWIELSQFTKPFITAFSDSDPITKGGETHYILKNGGHFLQEDCSDELINIAINNFKGIK